MSRKPTKLQTIPEKYTIGPGTEHTGLAKMFKLVEEGLIKQGISKYKVKQIRKDLRDELEDIDLLDCLMADCPMSGGKHKKHKKHSKHNKSKKNRRGKKGKKSHTKKQRGKKGKKSHTKKQRGGILNSLSYGLYDSSPNVNSSITLNMPSAPLENINNPHTPHQPNMPSQDIVHTTSTTNHFL